VKDARPGPGNHSGWRRWVGRLAPWVVSAGVVVLLLQRYSVETILLHIREGNAWMLIPWAIIATLVSFALMTTADWLLFRPSVGGIRWFTVLRGRGAASLITALSYSVGQGSYGVWLSRVSGTSVSKTVGLIAYIMLSDLTAVSLLAAGALIISGMPLASDLRWVVVGLAPAIAGALVLAGLIGSKVLPWLLPADKIIGLVSPWSTVPPKDYLLSLGCRFLNVFVAVVINWGAARSFGLDIPLAAFLTYLPIVFLVASLPVNVGPLGAVQVAWIHFFGPYATGEQILAFQVLFATMLVAGWVLRGLPFVGTAVREIRRGPTEDGSTTT